MLVCGLRTRWVQLLQAASGLQVPYCNTQSRREDTQVQSSRQVINNSCGTIAALNAAMNIPSQAEDNITIGPELENLRQFGAGMTSLE